MDPIKVIEGVKLWHRILNSLEKTNLDVDWITYIREALRVTILNQVVNFRGNEVKNPFLRKMDSSPSLLTNCGGKESFSLALNLFMSYINEKVLYDLRSFSKAPYLQLLLKDYYLLFLDLASYFDDLLCYRSVASQIIVFGYNILKFKDLQNATTMEFSVPFRAKLIELLLKIFNIEREFTYSDKKHREFEAATRTSCSKLILEDILKLEGFWKQSRMMSIAESNSLNVPKLKRTSSILSFRGSQSITQNGGPSPGCTYLNVN